MDGTVIISRVPSSREGSCFRPSGLIPSRRSGRVQRRSSIQSRAQSDEARCEATQPPARGVRALEGTAARKLRWRLVLSLGIAFVFTPQLAPGQDSPDVRHCIVNCEISCRSSPSPFLCQMNCGDDCGRRYNEPPRPYGSIAFGTHGAEAISWAKGSQEEADRNALATCNKYGTDCRIVFRYQYTCAALAVAMGSQHWEAATGYSEKDAEANAVSVCQGKWGKCLTNLSACSAKGGGKAFPPAPPKAISWGAIAYSIADMGAGWSMGKSDRASAEKEAMSICSQRGKACVLESAFNKQCGAVAADRSFAGWGVAPDQREAQRKAIEECTKAGGRRCVLHISICSF
jgi:hypothetical protein